MRWMMLMAALVAGCASATAVRGPDGTPHFAVHCGTAVNLCYEKMAEVCPAGYQVVDGRQGFFAAPVNGQMVAGSQHDFLVKCGPATAAAR